MSAKRTIPPANAPREYTDKVDFSREHENWGLRGSVMVHVRVGCLSTLINRLLLNVVLRDWQMTVRPSFGGDPRCLTFECHTMINADIDKGLPRLLKTLKPWVDEIVWKEGEWGYAIETDGTILRKWGLDDGMC